MTCSKEARSKVWVLVGNGCYGDDAEVIGVFDSPDAAALGESMYRRDNPPYQHDFYHIYEHEVRGL